jgi:hypothetical protein
MLKNAVHICGAKFGNIYLWDGDSLKAIAPLNTPAAFAEARERLSVSRGGKNPIARVIATKAVVHIPDTMASDAFAERDLADRDAWRDPNASPWRTCAPTFWGSPRRLNTAAATGAGATALNGCRSPLVLASKATKTDGLGYQRGRLFAQVIVRLPKSASRVISGRFPVAA